MAVCGGQRRPPRSDESQMLMVDLSHVQTTFFCSRVSLLLDLTALANHLAAFIPLTAFDLLSMSRLFIADHLLWKSLVRSVEANLGDLPPPPLVRCELPGRIRAGLQSGPVPEGRGQERAWIRR